ncbi:MAG: EAL domain-containing protein [Candidatus Thiodiazotropha sp. (ex Epidulcina cf. delphinae)]|nr:EAL domain-containing protein [Candidatus Thiodiazotropha sp. (ex Epidulcina cf. delphinae)]
MSWKTPFLTKVFASHHIFVLTACLFLSPCPADGDPVRSASEIDYPPLSIVLEDGTAGGFSVELLQGALKAMGREVSFEVGAWSEIKQDLEVGRLEALPLVGRTPEREEVFDFTVPYLSLFGAVFVRDEENDILALEDLRGRMVGVMRGDNAEEFIRRNTITERIIATKSFEEALLKLSQGELDAVVAQRLVGLNLIDKLGLRNIKTAIAPLTDFRQDFCFAVREGDKQLLALLNEGLSVVITDGTYERLRSKWLGILDRDKDQQTRYLMLTSTVVGFLSLFLLGLFLFQRWEAHHALKIGEEKLRMLFDNMAQGVFYQRSDGKLIDCNPAALKIFGLPREEFLNRTSMDPHWRVIREDGSDFPSEEHPSMQALLTGKPVDNVVAGILNPDKEDYVWVSINAIPQFKSGEEKPYQVFVTLHDITKRKLTEDKLRESELKFRLVTDTLSDVFWMSTRGIKNMLYINLAYETVWQKSRESLFQNPRSFIETLHPDDIDDYLEKIDRYHKHGEQYEIEYRIVMDDGEIKWIQEKGYPVQQTLDGNRLMAGMCIDITNRKQAEEKLHLAANVFTYAREGITITDADANIVDVNDAFTHITGYSREEVLGNNPRILKSGRQTAEFYTLMWDSLINKGQWYGEIWNRRKNGEVYTEFMNISAVRDIQGRIQHYVAVFSDITSQKRHQKQLEHIAHYDALTDLPNRVLLADRLHQAMVQSQRRRQKLAVVYLDLDGFKNINDTHGHEVGDQVLIILANRMKDAMREGDTIARLGGDEFVAVLIDLANTKESIPLISRLLTTVAQPIPIGDLLLQVSASLGIVLYPQKDEVSPDQLLRQADQAMYQAKLSGKNRYHIFDDEQDRSLRGYHESLERIQLALNKAEFVLYYQPKVNMRTGRIHGVEALIRWQHPDQGLLPPDHFLPLIENHSLSVELGEWIIDTALSQLESWRQTKLNLSMSINISAHHLQQPDFTDRLRKLIALHPGITPKDIILEVLETSALEDITQVSRVMQACNEMGMSFALDDFGTGYSSLTYLKRLPAAQIKVDQSFVRDMLESSEDLAILEGVLTLAIAFRRQAIAEGVETQAHAEMLLQLGCDLAQGYAIARPMPAADLLDWTETWQPPPNWKNQPVVSRNNIPLLFAGIEHQAWIRRIEEYIVGDSTTLPSLDIHKCHFGAWLDSEGMERYGSNPTLQVIESMHRQVHALAADLLALRAQNRTPEALAKLNELHNLRDGLLLQLKQLLASSQRL